MDKPVTLIDPSRLLRELFDSAVATADPMRFMHRHLPPKPTGRIVVVGAGKASARKAEAEEAEWGPCEGLVITRYGYGRPCRGIEIVEAAHPVPDDAGCLATARMLDLLDGLREGDFVLALVSGGASALLCAPANGITLAEKQAVNATLLASGAPIGAMNAVRKQLSRVKGGQLAAAASPARLLALMISDVPGDDPAIIGSGPTVGDAGTFADARAILDQWNVAVPASVGLALSGGGRTIHPADPRLSKVENRVVAAPSQSLEAAAQLARDRGCEVRILGDAIEGEASVVAVAQAELARTLSAERAPDAPPLLLLSGGELTVTRRGAGTGGPNSEFCLALALALNGAAGIHAIACDTDGVDGAAEVAGAVVSPYSLHLARQVGLDPVLALSNNDAHSFFGLMETQVVTGPTMTNVNDFRAILVT